MSGFDVEMCFVLMRELEAHSSEESIEFWMLEGVFVEDILDLVGKGNNALRHLDRLDDLSAQRIILF